MSKPKDNVTAEQAAEACLLHIDELLAPPLDANVVYEAMGRIIEGLEERRQASRDQVLDPQPPGDVPGP